MTVAILTCNIGNTFKEYREKLGNNLEQIRFNHRRIFTKDGTEYVLCSDIRHIIGMEFNRYELSKFYWTLEDEVKSRIR